MIEFISINVIKSTIFLFLFAQIKKSRTVTTETLISIRFYLKNNFILFAINALDDKMKEIIKA